MDDDDDSTSLGWVQGNDGKEYLDMEVFASGVQEDSTGDKEVYTEEDLKDIASTYDGQVATRPAPVCIGHPTMSSPAYGWVQKMWVTGDKLVARLGELHPAFAEALKAGRYKTRSISLYDDGRTRHIGMLGGAQPAVEGLQPLQFAEQIASTYKTYNQEITPMENREVEDLKRQLTFFEKLFAKFGMEVKAEETAKAKDHAQDPNKDIMDKEKGSGTEEATLPADANADVQTKEVGKEIVDPKVEVTTTKQQEAEVLKIAADETAENTKLKALVAELEKKLATLEGLLKEKEVSDNKSFCESLVKDGKLRPADLTTTLTIMDQKAYIDSIRNFAQDGRPTQVDEYRQHLSAAPKIIEFGESVAIAEAMPTVTVPSVHEMVERHMRDSAGKMSYLEAYSKVCAECPDHPEFKAMARAADAEAVQKGMK